MPTRGLRLHARRLAVEAVNLLLNHDTVFQAVGAVNRRAGVIESVFLVYPASERHAHAYAYGHRLQRNRWKPCPTGLLWQNGRATLMVAVSSHDDHFHDDAHRDRLVELADRVESLRQLVGARQKTFAGVLPGVLSSRGILTDTPESDITAAMVAQAVRQVAQDAPDGEPVPVIVLGAHGYIGRRLVELLRQEMPVHPVDTALPDSPWPDHLHGRPALLVNVANRHALAGHLDRLWPGLTVLNEVYPEPEADVMAALDDRGIPVHHVAGVAGRAFPPFPSAYAAYAGAIPCCAAWPSDQARVVVRRLSGGAAGHGSASASVESPSKAS